MSNKIKSFRDLNIWKLSMELVENIYGITETFPAKETYGLSSQMRRCAVSIPSNIAEGFTRRHEKEYKQFIYIALGSCAELETQLEIALRLEYINDQTLNCLVDKTNHTTRMGINLIKNLS